MRNHALVRRVASPFAATLLLGCAAALLAGGGPPPAPAGSGDQEMPRPGDEHTFLKKRVGTWKVQAKVRWTPEMPWMEFEGKDVVTSGCGGFWVFSTLTCTFMNMPFEGRQQMGYDQHRKKFVSTWVDSFSSTVSTSEGKYDAKAQVLRMSGEAWNEQLGKVVPQRSEVHFEDDDTSVVKLWNPGPDGKEFLNMEFTYSRMR